MAKYVTIMDIARELGISKSTVSRALSGDTGNVPSFRFYIYNKVYEEKYSYCTFCNIGFHMDVFSILDDIYKHRFHRDSIQRITF